MLSKIDKLEIYGTFLKNPDKPELINLNKVKNIKIEKGLDKTFKIAFIYDWVVTDVSQRAIASVTIFIIVSSYYKIDIFFIKTVKHQIIKDIIFHKKRGVLYDGDYKM